MQPHQPLATGLRFWIPGKLEPGGSKRWLPTHGRLGGRPIVVDANPRAKAWKAVVASYALLEARRVGWALVDGPVELRMVMVLERPKGHHGPSGALRTSAPAWPAVRPDCGKLARPIEDGLTQSGAVYHDDSRIVREVLEKRYGEAPGVWVEVTVLDGQPPDDARLAVGDGRAGGARLGLSPV